MAESTALPEDLAAAGFTPTSTEQVLTARVGSLGRIMLNNPRAINALTLPMVRAVTETLETWRADDSITAITIEGAGERGLCAGGDVVSVRNAYLASTRGDGEFSDATEFFTAEYGMNAMLANYPKLIVSYQDGIVMGGGIGISAYCGLRLATERTKIAMPETIIGFFPDVGALYLLARASGGLGAYLALTGVTITGADAVQAGLSDHVIDSGTWGQVLDRLADGADAEAAIAGLVMRHETFAPTGLMAQRAWITECFGSPTDARSAVEIRDALQNHDKDVAREAGQLLAQRSPISVAVTLEALRRAASMDSVEDVLKQDRVLAEHMLIDGDFVEGVRAQLVDKDRTPHWSITDVADVPASLVAGMFEPRAA